MFWAIFVSVIILGFAYFIKSFANVVFEFRNTFLAIIGLFLVLYIGAAIFVSYSLKDVNAKNQNPGTTDGNIFIVDEQIQELDLSTGP